jgi:hypothetical protein
VVRLFRLLQWERTVIHAFGLHKHRLDVKFFP